MPVRRQALRDACVDELVAQELRRDDPVRKGSADDDGPDEQDAECDQGSSRGDADPQEPARSTISVTSVPGRERRRARRNVVGSRTPYRGEYQPSSGLNWRPSLSTRIRCSASGASGNVHSSSCASGDVTVSRMRSSSLDELDPSGVGRTGEATVAPLEARVVPGQRLGPRAVGHREEVVGPELVLLVAVDAQRWRGSAVDRNRFRSTGSGV